MVENISHKNLNNKFPKGFRYFHVVAIVFAVSLIIANTVAVKIISLAGLNIPAGILIFPISYIANDILTEVYGFKKARSIIWWSFVMLFVMTLVYYFATIIKPADFWQNQEAFEVVFSVIPRIAIGSLVAFVVGSLLNSIVLSKMKVKMEGKHLWMRTIGSTVIGEGVDSIIFNIIAFWGIFDTASLITIIGSGFLLKTLYEIAATPFTYFIINRLKKLEDIDNYDIDVKYKAF